MKAPVLLFSILSYLFAISLAATNIFSPFIDPFLQGLLGTGNDTHTHDLRRRQGTDCPDGYGTNCAGIGAAGLCCPDNSVCSADAAGNAACCPRGAACTGSITATSTTRVTTTTGTNNGNNGGDDNNDGSTTFGGVIIGGNDGTSTTSFVIAGTAVQTITSDGVVITTTQTFTQTTTGAFVAGTGTSSDNAGIRALATPPAAGFLRAASHAIMIAGRLCGLA